MLAISAGAWADEGERDVWVNGLRMDADQILILEDHFGVRLRDGAYVYDPVSGDFRAAAMSKLKGNTTDDPQYAEFPNNSEPITE
jgi:hypothetical protein